MKRKSILSGLIALCAVCIFPAPSYSQSPQIGITTGRAQALVAAAVGLISLVIGGLALARAAGGLGTGNGLGGGIVAMIVGMIGMALGGLALARLRMPSARGEPATSS